MNYVDGYYFAIGSAALSWIVVAFLVVQLRKARNEIDRLNSFDRLRATARPIANPAIMTKEQYDRERAASQPKPKQTIIPIKGKVKS